MKTSIPSNEKESILHELGKANKAFQKIYPGDKPDRQPVHTVYGGADLFTADSAEKNGTLGIKDTLKQRTLTLLSLQKPIELSGHETLPADAAGIESLIKKIGQQFRNRSQKRNCLVIIHYLSQSN